MTDERIATLEARVEALEAILKRAIEEAPPEPDPLVIGTVAFREIAKVKKAALKGAH